MAEARGRPLWLRFRSRRIVQALEAEAHAALAQNDAAAALAALETLAGRYRWHAPVETLLFRRAARPTKEATAVALLRGIAAGAGFRRHHCAYAAVSLAYRAAAAGDHALARELQAGLEGAVAELEADPATLHCRRRNRENRLKRLISSRAALVHLALLLGEQGPLATTGPWAHALLAQLDFNRLPADVSLRLLSNFGRCLALQGPAAPRRLREDLECLVAEADRPRHRHSRAPEDHIGFLRRLLADLESGEPLLAILNVDTPELQASLGSFWQAARQEQGA